MAVGQDTPIIWTVFSPLMVLPFLLTGGRAQAVALMRSEPTAVEHALDAMAVTLEAYARAAVESGADGLFYATNMATAELSTAAECRRFQRPYDLRILARVENSPFNMLHVCGAGVLFDEFADYPATALSWATSGSTSSTSATTCGWTPKAITMSGCRAEMARASSRPLRCQPLASPARN